ncbi:hypothetical protein [Shewanella sp. MEBiC00475]|uniref:hypothetical protein n=1 Tax=Shewanella sp. MEBiC00475 TaxID=2575361 RepID=UPI001C30BC83|nr:hypothetical protein [Shewanella sp. MEBiC00475]
MSQASKKFILNPMGINETLARGARKRLQRECVENINSINIVGNGGDKNLQKKCKRLFKDGTVSGFYIGEKNLFAMLVMFDERDEMFGGAYIARIDGKLSLYYSDIRFSKHSIERLIQRLKTKSPRIEVAKAIHAQTKFAFSREQQIVINNHEKWRTPGLNDIDIAIPYKENEKLLGMWFLASTSNISCDFVGKCVATTFVDSEKLREPQYAKCMELLHAQNEAILMNKKMPNQDLLNRNLTPHST